MVSTYPSLSKNTLLLIYDLIKLNVNTKLIIPLDEVNIYKIYTNIFSKVSYNIDNIKYSNFIGKQYKTNIGLLPLFFKDNIKNKYSKDISKLCISIL